MNLKKIKNAAAIAFLFAILNYTSSADASLPKVMEDEASLPIPSLVRQEGTFWGNAKAKLTYATANLQKGTCAKPVGDFFHSLPDLNGFQEGHFSCSLEGKEEIKSSLVFNVKDDLRIQSMEENTPESFTFSTPYRHSVIGNAHHFIMISGTDSLLINSGSYAQSRSVDCCINPFSTSDHQTIFPAATTLLLESIMDIASESEEIVIHSLYNCNNRGEKSVSILGIVGHYCYANIGISNGTMKVLVEDPVPSYISEDIHYNKSEVLFNNLSNKLGLKLTEHRMSHIGNQTILNQQDCGMFSSVYLLYRLNGCLDSTALSSTDVANGFKYLIEHGYIEEQENFVKIEGEESRRLEEGLRRLKEESRRLKEESRRLEEGLRRLEAIKFF